MHTCESASHSKLQSTGKEFVPCTLFVFKIARWLVIFVLIVASAMKIAPLIYEVVPTTTVSVVYVLIGCLELVLALSLIGIPNSQMAISFAGVFFFIAVLVSGVKYLQGVESCGCFGRVLTPPSFSLGVAALCLSASLYLRRYSKDVHIRRDPSSRSIRFRIAVALASYAFALLAFLAFEPHGVVYSKVFGGRPWSLEPPFLQFQTDPTLSVDFTKTVVFQNNSARSVNLIGYSTDCGSLIGVRPMPLHVRSYSSVELTLVFRQKGRELIELRQIARAQGFDNFSQMSNAIPAQILTIFTDDASYPEIRYFVREEIDDSLQSLNVQ